MNTLICIVGPTAIGKTQLSIQLAKKLNTEIISSDSRQFYREMNIGTAKPTTEELQEVPHHFINNLSIHNDYSVGDFEKEVLEKLEELFKKHQKIIMVGGSGLYEKAVTQGLDIFPEVAKEVREELNQLYQQEGIRALQNLLQEKDLMYYKEVDIYNPQRIIRALEVCLSTGKTYSEFRKKNTIVRNFKVQKIGLTAPREIIYQRINQRVKLMMEQGLLEEAKSLHKYKHLNALQTVGYKELYEYLEEKIDLETAISEIKKNTRRFAKRQLTWYRKDEEIQWFEYNKTQEIPLLFD